MVADWKRSGLGVLAFCRSRRIHRSGFHRWRAILDKLDQQVASASTSQSAPAAASSSTHTAANRKAPTAQRVAISAKPVFVPVRVLSEPLVEVVLVSGLIVKAPLHADPTIIARLVRAVTAC